MKIKCDKCDATYNIPDEKLTDKEKKIKCKKCDGIVVIPALKTEEIIGDILGEPDAEIVSEPEVSETKENIDKFHENLIKEFKFIEAVGVIPAQASPKIEEEFEISEKDAKKEEKESSKPFSSANFIASGLYCNAFIGDSPTQ